MSRNKGTIGQSQYPDEEHACIALIAFASTSGREARSQSLCQPSVRHRGFLVAIHWLGIDGFGNEGRRETEHRGK